MTELQDWCFPMLWPYQELDNNMEVFIGGEEQPSCWHLVNQTSFFTLNWVLHFQFKIVQFGWTAQQLISALSWSRQEMRDVKGHFGTLNPILLLLLNRWVSAKLAPAFSLLWKILTLRNFFYFYFRKKIHKTKVARNYEKIKVKWSQTWPPSQ